MVQLHHVQYLLQCLDIGVIYFILTLQDEGDFVINLLLDIRILAEVIEKPETCSSYLLRFFKDDSRLPSQEIARGVETSDHEPAHVTFQFFFVLNSVQDTVQEGCLFVIPFLSVVKLSMYGLLSDQLCYLS